MTEILIRDVLIQVHLPCISSSMQIYFIFKQTKVLDVFFVYTSRCFAVYDIELYKLHLEAMFKGLLIHLDDPDKAIQVCGFLF